MFKLQINNLNSGSLELKIKEISKFYTNERKKWIFKLYGDHHVLNIEDCEDCMQDATISLIDKITNGNLKFTSRAKFYAYFQTTLLNKALDLLKASSRRKTQSLKEADFFYLDQTSIKNLQDEFDIENQKELFIEALYFLKKVNLTYVHIIKLAFIEKMSNKEIATTLSLSVETVKSYRRDAFKQLRVRFVKQTRA